MDAPDDEEPHHDSEFAEYDLTGRYCRYKEVLGRGAFKTVYKAFDEFEGIEVAWNQIKVFDVARNHDDLDRLCFEVHLLQTLKHKNIIKFYKSWVDTNNDNINFITEIFTSGTLRQYRKKYKRVELQALKNWSRQILRGLFYLHSHDPPVIHRDLKCDNIFVNGNTGEVKIGDLGLAATLCKANSAHTVIGTPEFMAPELYEEQYNELVDIYAFGMCLLELVTLEYPYMECANPAQIYKKVSAGVKPLSLGQVKDPEVRKFIDKCIANVSERLSARELIMDPFLASNPEDTKILHENIPTDASDYEQHHPVTDITFFGFKDSLPISNGSFSVEGQRKDQNTIFLKLCIVDSTGYIRNIHFPFDIEADTSISVASEMVSELDLTDQNLSTIAAMIDSEIQAHVPSWHPGEDFEDNLSDKQVEPNEYEVEHEETIKTEGETSNHPTLDGLMLEQVSSSPSDTRDSPNDDANVTLVESTHSVSSSATHETNEPDESPEILEAITQKLGQLLLEQQKELLELKNKHELATDDVLKELPPELRSSALHLCQLKYSNHEDSTKSDGHGHGVQCGSQMNEDLINNPLSTSTSEQLDQSKAGEVDNYEIGSDLPP